MDGLSILDFDVVCASINLNAMGHEGNRSH